MATDPSRSRSNCLGVLPTVPLCIYTGLPGAAAANHVDGYPTRGADRPHSDGYKTTALVGLHIQATPASPFWRLGPGCDCPLAGLKLGTFLVHCLPETIRQETKQLWAQRLCCQYEISVARPTDRPYNHAGRRTAGSHPTIQTCSRTDNSHSKLPARHLSAGENVGLLHGSAATSCSVRKGAIHRMDQCSQPVCVDRAVLALLEARPPAAGHLLSIQVLFSPSVRAESSVLLTSEPKAVGGSRGLPAYRAALPVSRRQPCVSSGCLPGGCLEESRDEPDSNGVDWCFVQSRSPPAGQLQHPHGVCSA